jgi:SOS-response transcriptional repressor LexA
MNKVGRNIKFLRESQGLSQVQLAELCGWENPSRISNYENTGRQPSLEDIEVIARALHTIPANLAFEDCTQQKNIFRNFTGVPILDWQDVENWPHEKEKIFNTKKLDFLRAQSVNAGVNCYALRINDDSMMGRGGEHSFNIGSYIIIDPNKERKHKDFVIARKENGVIIFREYTNYSGDEYLGMLKGDVLDRSIRLTSNIKIYGVVVAYLDILT